MQNIAPVILDKYDLSSLLFSLDLNFIENLRDINL